MVGLQRHRQMRGLLRGIEILEIIERGESGKLGRTIDGLLELGPGVAANSNNTVATGNSSSANCASATASRG